MNALKGKDGVDGKDGAQGQDGQNGVDGISVQNVAIENNHLMVTLSNGQVLDAGEMPAGSGGGSGITPEEKAELERLIQKGRIEENTRISNALAEGEERARKEFEEKQKKYVLEIRRLEALLRLPFSL